MTQLVEVENYFYVHNQQDEEQPSLSNHHVQDDLKNINDEEAYAAFKALEHFEKNHYQSLPDLSETASNLSSPVSFIMEDDNVILENYINWGRREPEFETEEDEEIYIKRLFRSKYLVNLVSY